MAQIIPQVSARKFLDGMITTGLLGGTANLFKNDLSPNQLTVLADFTQADFSGYVADKGLDGWIPAATVDGHAKTLGDVLSWSHDGGGVNNQIFGIYCTLAGELIYAERFAGAPITMQAGSPTLPYIPVFTLISEFLS